MYQQGLSSPSSDAKEGPSTQLLVTSEDTQHCFPCIFLDDSPPRCPITIETGLRFDPFDFENVSLRVYDGDYGAESVGVREEDGDGLEDWPNIRLSRGWPAALSVVLQEE